MSNLSQLKEALNIAVREMESFGVPSIVAFAKRMAEMWLALTAVRPMTSGSIPDSLKKAERAFDRLTKQSLAMNNTSRTTANEARSSDKSSGLKPR
jgi:hypothetical protein